jgi:SAM-dependent methyltransferase
VPDEDGLRDFYDRAYAPTDDTAAHGRWRELSAVGKADHVQRLAGRVGLAAPAIVLEVGCGSGAVIAELGRRGFGAQRIGLDFSEAAVGIAAQRPELTRADVFDGAHLPLGDGSVDLAFASHLLEHVPDPAPLVAEMTRVARAVIIEVPLEDNLAARRPAARAASAQIGHVQRFDRASVRGLVTSAGWRVRAEIVDPLPLAVHLFGHSAPGERIAGAAKWAARRTLTLAPGLGERLFTVHYALVATP